MYLENSHVSVTEVSYLLPALLISLPVRCIPEIREEIHDLWYVKHTFGYTCGDEKSKNGKVSTEPSSSPAQIKADKSMQGCSN